MPTVYTRYILSYNNSYRLESKSSLRENLKVSKWPNKSNKRYRCKKNSKIKSNNNFDFLEDFWTGIVNMTKYDKQFYEDHVHMNKETNTKFYDKLLTLIKN